MLSSPKRGCFRYYFQFLLLYSLNQVTHRKREVMSFQFLLLYSSSVPEQVSGTKSSFNSYYCIPMYPRLLSSSSISFTFNSYYCIPHSQCAATTLDSRYLSILTIVFSWSERGEHVSQTYAFNSYYCILLGHRARRVL